MSAAIYPSSHCLQNVFNWHSLVSFKVGVLSSLLIWKLAVERNVANPEKHDHDQSWLQLRWKHFCQGGNRFVGKSYQDGWNNFQNVEQTAELQVVIKH